MKYRILAILLVMTTASYAADSSVTGMTQLASPAANDWMYTIDVSDTTDAAAGTGKKILASDMMTIWISDTAWSGSVWNAITTIAPSKNAVYDYLHLMAAADDGKVSQLNTTAAGFVPTNSSGVIGTARVITAGNYITVTNGDGSGGNPTVAFDPTKLTGNQTWADGSNASLTWTWNLSGTDPVITIGSGLLNVTTGSLQVGGVDVVTTSGTQTLSNKTTTTEAAGDNDTSVASTAFVQTAARDALGGTHSSPLTGAQSPTWNSVTEVLFYGATGTITLPTAASYAGRSIVIYNTGAFTITIDSTGSEVLVRDGTVQTGGVSMTLSSGAGNYVALVCDGVRWITLGFKGTLAVGS